MKAKQVTAKLRVAILDDHQSILDGYQFRLSHNPDLEVVGTALNAEEFETVLSNQKPDIVVTDVFVPTSPENPNSFPILEVVPQWLQRYPNLTVLVISIYCSRTLVKAVMKAGASGYILKSDQAAIKSLDDILWAVAEGGIHLSRQAHQFLLQEDPETTLLTSRQLEALSLSAAFPDATTHELAKRLGIANSTMRNLLSETYLRLEVHNRAAAIAKARQRGLITPQEPFEQPGQI